MEANGGRERRAPTYDDRLEIERGLNRGDRIAWIARTIGRAPKVVADEVRRNWTDDPQGMLVVRTRNICTKEAGCQARGLRCADVPRHGCVHEPRQQLPAREHGVDGPGRDGEARAPAGGARRIRRRGRRPEGGEPHSAARAALDRAFIAG